MIRQIDTFTSEIAKTQRSGGKPLSLRIGTVTEITGTLVTVTLGGSTITRVHMLASYTPTVGDTVALLRSGATTLVLGRIV